MYARIDDIFVAGLIEKQTGRSDIPLTANGELKAQQMGAQLVGPGSTSSDF